MDHSHHLVPAALATWQQILAANPHEVSGFIVILSYSFFASLHCGFMCSPLVCATLTTAPANKKYWALVAYNLSRLVGYTLAGGVLGYLSATLAGAAQIAGNILAWLVGGGVILLGLGLARAAFAVPRSYLLWGRLRLGPLVAKVSGLSPVAGHALLGLLTVLLPCMTLTPALALAAAAMSPLGGGLVMLAFGLGTVPMMVVAPGVSQVALAQIPRRLLTGLAPAFLVLAGVLTIMRGFAA